MSPRITEGTDNLQTVSNYHFSAPPIDQLGATEYTLATVVVDKSGSVSGFKNELEGALKTILDACQKSPRAENLMLRVVAFNEKVHEIHGFRLLKGIGATEYDNAIRPSGMTALFDATHTAIEAMSTYGEKLTGSDFLANGIVFVITDGEDNESSFSASRVKDLLDDIRKREVLESVRTVLIGVNENASVKKHWNDFHKTAGLDQIISIGDANASKLAKLADFISQSISSQSQALGSGGPSQALTF